MSVQWGIYLALFDSTTLVFASVLLFVETAPSKAAAPFLRSVTLGSGGGLRARRARVAQKAAEVAKQTMVEATANERIFLPTRQKFGVGRFANHLATEAGFSHRFRTP